MSDKICTPHRRYGLLLFTRSAGARLVRAAVSCERYNYNLFFDFRSLIVIWEIQIFSRTKQTDEILTSDGLNAKRYETCERTRAKSDLLFTCDIKRYIDVQKKTSRSNQDYCDRLIGRRLANNTRALYGNDHVIHKKDVSLNEIPFH